MKHPYLIFLVLCLTATLLWSQSNPVPSIKRASVAPSLGAPQADPKAQAKVLDTYGKLPLSFEANQGQTDARVKFLSRTSGYSLFLTGDEAVLALSTKKANTKAKIVGTAHTSQSNMPEFKAGGVLRMKLRKANLAAKVSGMDELAGTSNYFIGNDPSKWRTNVPTYAKVKYEGIYSGINLVYYGNQRQLEYDFIVAPGADPRRIQFDVRGAKRIRQDRSGELVFKVGAGEIRWHKPLVYQGKDGARQEIAARYAITEPNRVGFEVAEYDASRALYIDPLIYSTYLGGSGDDFGNGVAVDSTGNVYVSGSTASTDFPTKNPLQPANAGGSDIFVTKINAAGSALVYSTYLGGSGDDFGSGIAVDGPGNVYIVGQTSSTDFPTKNALQPVYGGGDGDAFVTKINAAGSALVYSTYLGGAGHDAGVGIAVDSAGNAYITGVTDSANFPTTPGSFQTSCAGGACADAFVSKLNSEGSALVYSTYLGGSGGDVGVGIAVDSAANAYVTGYTASTDFPTKNPLQGYSGKYDIFVTKFNPAGSALVYSTYLGGPEEDFGNGIVADSSGNAYVAGVNYTNYCNRVACYYYAFVDKINPTGSAFVYRYTASQNYTAGNGVAVDSAGSAYLIGSVGSDTVGKVYRAFVEKLDPSGSEFGPLTFLAGGPSTYGYGIAADDSDHAYVTGATSATRFPTKKPIQPANAGGSDAFVAEIDMRIVTTTTLTSSPNPSTYGQAVTFTAVVTSALGAPPDGETVTFKQGATVLGTKTLSSGTTTLSISTLGGGSHTITAVYGGDSNLGGSTSKAVSQVISKATTTTTSASSLNPSNFGQSVTFTASVTPQFGGTVTGTVTFYDGTTLLKTVGLSGGVAKFTTSTLASGTHSITAVYGGNSNFSGSTSAPVNQVVLVATTTTLSSFPIPSAYGQAVAFTAEVISTLGAPPPDGEIISFMKGTTVLGTGTLSGGSASFMTSTLPVGTNVIKAVYGGDLNLPGSTSKAVSQVVSKATTTTALTSSLNPSNVGQSVTFTASVTPQLSGTVTGPVTFYDGTTALKTVSLSGEVAKFTTSTLASSTHTITATYNSSTSFSGSSASLTQTVN